MTSLTNASNALNAQQYGLDVTGQNIANINTSGYARRQVQLAEVALPGGGSDGGVTIVGAPAQRDAFLEARLRAEQPIERQNGAVADSLSVVQTALGGAGSSLDGALSAFFQSFGTLAQDPTSSVARDGVVRQGTQLAASFNDLSSQFDTSIKTADAQIRGGLTEINALASQIASLNAAIGGANGADAEALKDKQSVAITSLTQLAGVNVMARSDGGVDVTVGNGRALVIGANTYALGATSTPPSGQAAITSGGVDITSEVSGGQVGGWLQVRDTLVPGYKSQLDQLAMTVAQQVNAVHSAGYDLSGKAGGNFFTPIAAAPGAAAAIAVNPALAADSSLVAASQTGTSGDNQTAKALAALADAPVAGGGTATFTQAWSQLVYKIGSDAQTAQSNQENHQTILSAVQRLRDSVSGVSLDDEATSLMTFQRGYQANAKYFSTVNTVLDVLFGMAGVTLS
ncbi:MAG: flagellar hook-associated protein FlgK [Vicinamibacterales bacterium]